MKKYLGIVLSILTVAVFTGCSEKIYEFTLTNNTDSTFNFTVADYTEIQTIEANSSTTYLCDNSVGYVNIIDRPDNILVDYDNDSFTRTIYYIPSVDYSVFNKGIYPVIITVKGTDYTVSPAETVSISTYVTSNRWTYKVKYSDTKTETLTDYSEMLEITH